MVPSSRARHFPAAAFSASLGMTLQFTDSAALSCAWYTSPRINLRVTLGPTSTSRARLSAFWVTKSFARSSSLTAHEVLLVVRHIDERQSLRTPTVGHEVPRAFVVVVDRRGRESPALGRFGILAAARELLWCLGLESVV